MVSDLKPNFEMKAEQLLAFFKYRIEHLGLSESQYDVFFSLLTKLKNLDGLEEKIGRLGRVKFSTKVRQKSKLRMKGEIYRIIKQVNGELNPLIPILNDSIDTKKLSVPWQDKLSSINLPELQKTIKGVGRIQKTNSGGDKQELGTGWFIAKNIIVTNIHVADDIFKKDSPEIDLKVEWLNPLTEVVKIKNILYPSISVLDCKRPSIKRDIGYFFFRNRRL
jgi:hypothetical protein